MKKSACLKLDERSEDLLGIVREACVWDPVQKKCGITYVPSSAPVASVYGLRPVVSYVSGSGDAAKLRALERRGLIKATGLADYAYAVTESGVAEYNRILATRHAACAKGKP